TTLLFTSHARPAHTATLFPYTTLFRSPGTPCGNADFSPERTMVEKEGPSAPNLRIRYSNSPVNSDSVIPVFTFLIPSSSTFSIRSEEHTSELQSRFDLVCRLLLEK